MKVLSPLLGLFKKIFPILLFFLVTLLYADIEPNNSCAKEEIISELHNKTISVSHAESGSVQKNSDTYDYYKFTAGISGNVNISLTTNKTNNSIIVGSSCEGSNYYSDITNSNTKIAPAFSVTAGTTIHIRIERRYATTMTYNLNISIDDGTITTSQRNFTLRNPANSRNILGDYQVIGNTVLCVKKDGSCYDYTKSSANHNLDLKFIDVDNTNNTFNNSSQAKLSIPPSAKVKWAAIYAQGHILNKNQSQTVAILKDPMKITVPSISGTISSIPKQIDLYPRSGSNGYTYSTYSDIPELVGLEGSAINGMVTVANVKAYEGKEDSGLGNYGAWTLVVIYESDNISLKNISVFDGYRIIKDETGFNDIAINIDGFITPTSGNIVSRVSIFAGEGDKNIVGDKLYLNDTQIGNKGNAFYSHITSDIVRNPSYSNNQGIDIQTFDVGTNGLNLIKNSDYNARIKFSSTGDHYYPSLAIFSTELYEPRVCYKQEFFNELGDPIVEDIKVGDTITVHTWISNMKKDSLDVNLETADKVEITVELDNENFEYIPNTIKIKNVYELDFSNKTDAIKDDIADFLFDTNTTKWRVGTGANSTNGGELTPNITASNDNKAFVEFQVKLLQEGDIHINNIYKVSYENPQLGVRFGDESPINIGVCADIDTALAIGGVLGKFNVVNENGGNGSFNDPSSPETYLNTQVVNRPFNVKILSLNENGTALKPFTGNVSVSLIENPYDGSCGNSEICKQAKCENAVPISATKDITFNGSYVVEQFNYIKATKSALFRVNYGTANDPKFACSIDGFAIRPDRFELSAPAGEHIELLTSAKNYNFSLIAAQYGNNMPSSEYNVANVDSSSIALKKILYMPDGSDGTAVLNGSLNYTSTSFNIVDGSANNVVGINFTDVGRVNIKMIDKTWAKYDIDNGDTIESCDSQGAWVCGDINATFIPSHFALSGVELHNNSGSTFTYISDDLNISAPYSVVLTAQNALNATTQNFDKDSWENPVNVSITLPTVIGMTPNKNELDLGLNLDFVNGVKNILSNDSNLSFNFNREVNKTINPFVIEGGDTNLTAISQYSASGTTKDITGTNTAANKATFIYGRTHAPRQRYTDNSGSALIYFEAYCFGTDANGVSCDKLLLPNGLNSRNTNDLRWFVNSQHDTNHGVIGNVVEKNALGRVNPTGQTGINSVTTVDMTYTEDQGYPYKTTMENNASSWLIHNEHDAGATTNQFPVEFSKASSEWSGKHETDTTTNDHNATNTNRRSMW
ncbi:hypothetical protein M947_06585 [Sulfurimonas hongkongensis]|uniref:Uncharacterized protein n=1 Tax=Sulfurimonas hongkongensis TaxID=1172190 RepID=T0JNJ9_9BACT|nr:hypothetical protein [Sulfurimonas hongkongensis]EQB39656.1 hypothetical protein M947_06585 [Sulfurimonas hongkongensis]